MFSKHHNPVALNTFSHHAADPPNAGGGHPIDFPCPDNARIRITNIQFTLTTLIINCYPMLYIIPPAGADILIAASDVAPPNLSTTTGHFSTGITDSIYRLADTYLQSPLPVDLFLIPGEILSLTTANLSGPVDFPHCLISYDQWIIA